MICYNPNKRPDLPKTIITGKHLIAPDDHFIGFHNKVDNHFTFSSYEDALKSTSSGPCWWFEGQDLYGGHRTPDWDMKPVTEENQPVCEGGINWCHCYFLSKEDAESYFQMLGRQHDIYEEDEFGVVAARYHY